VSDTTPPVTAWLDDAQDMMADPCCDRPDPDLHLAAQTLLDVVEKVLDMHRPTSAMSWCKECSASYPCNTRREITAALLGEDSDV
jgi:hypothetical protein